MAIGIDCGGRKYTAVWVENGEITAITDYAVDESVYLRATAMADLMDHMHRHWRNASRCDDVWVEAPIVAGVRNLQSSLRVAQVTGLVQACLYNAREVAVSSWKKAVAGSGNLDKDGVRTWVQQNHPQQYRQLGTQDAVDAYCIALYGETISARSTDYRICISQA